MLNVEKTIQSEYANSPTIAQLIENMNGYLDPRANILAFYNTVWNVNTAVGFGLDIWGRIVGVSRVIPIPGNNRTFGFDNSDFPFDWQNFGSTLPTGKGGPFSNGQIITGGYTLNDNAFRTLILTKALANITATTASALNALIQNLFPGRGTAFVVDRGNMAMTYVFQFPLTTIEYAILAFSGVLPHPAGVLVNVIVVPSGFLGFKEQGPPDVPFGQGPFYSPATG